MKGFDFKTVRKLLKKGLSQAEISRQTGQQRQDISLVARAWGYRFKRGRSKTA
jgi:transcriptional regulator